jgi:dynein heavy chain
VVSVLAQILEEYNDRHNKLNVVLFDDVLEHLTRVHRVLRMHKGHIMIVGVGGSGKQSLLRLAAFAAGTDRICVAESDAEAGLSKSDSVLRCQLSVRQCSIIIC